MKKNAFMMMLVMVATLACIPSGKILAQTDCSNIAVPYVQDFESVADYSLPECWGQINPFVQGNYPVVESYQPHGGSKALRFRTFETPQFAVMPQFAAALNTLQVTFWTRRHNSSSGTFSVGYLTDASNAASFVTVWSNTAAQMGNNNYQSVTVGFENVAVDPALDYRIAFRYEAANAYVFWYVDDITVEAIPSCNTPYGLTTSEVTSTSATLSWSGLADSYTVYYKATDDTVWNETPFVTLDAGGFLIEGLNPATTYQWYVVSDCGDTLLPSAGTATFTTECGVYPTPFAENFNAANGMPICWNRMTGTAASAFAGTSPTSINGGWNFYTAYVFGQYHPRLNIYGSSISRWIVTPPIDLSSTIAPGLSFKLALTRNNVSTAVTPGEQPNQRFMVMVSTDMGVSWSSANATVWSNDGNGDFVLDSVPATGETVTLPLSQYVGDTIMVAFYGESTDGGGDNDLHIDDIEVGELSNCAKPTSLEAYNMTSTSVTLDWTEAGDATSWNVRYGVAGTPADDTGISVTATNSHPFTVGGLTTGETYDFYVQADCGNEQSGWTGPVTMRPGFLNMRISGSDTLTSCSAMVYDNGGASGNYSNNCNSVLVIFPEVVGGSVSIQGQVNTEQGYDTLWVYDGVGTDNAPIAACTGSNQTLPLTISSSGPLTLRFMSDLSTNSSGFALEVNCITCFPPTGLAVSGITDNSAVVTWNGNENIDSWLVAYKAATDTAWIEMAETDTTLTLNNLNEGEYYEVQVRTDCGGEYSLPATLTFATAMNAVPLPYSTGFGVGEDRVWKLSNGNCANRWTLGAADSILFISADGATPGYNVDGAASTVSAEKIFTVGTGGSFDISFDVQVGGEANYDYLKVFFAPEGLEYPASDNFPAYAMASSDTFAVDFSSYTPQGTPPAILMLTDGMTHVEMTMPNPNAVTNDSSRAKLVFVWRNDNTDGAQPGAVIDNISVSTTSCPQPGNVAIASVTPNSAVLTWQSSDDASVWNVEYREIGTEAWTTATATDTTHTLTGLMPGTPYVVQVQADCGASQSLWVPVSLTTECETVTALPYTEGFETMNQLPACWRQEYVTGTLSWTTHSGDATSFTSAHGGNLNAFISQSSYDTATTRLVTPVFDLSGATTPYISYWVLQQAYGADLDRLTVYYRTAADAPWQQLAQYDNSIADWMRDSLALPSPLPFCQFAFEGRVNYGYGIALDDFTVGDAGFVVTNPTVTTNTATNVQQGTATLNGTVSNPDNVTLSAKGFQWKQASAGDYTTVTVTDDELTYNLSGLTAGTEYTFRAFITFDGNTVYGDEANFTTLPESGDAVAEYLENSIAIFPNPANTILNVRMRFITCAQMIEIFNTVGTRLFASAQPAVENGTIQINVSGLADGMYFVRVTTDMGIVTKPFVVKR